MSFRITEQDIHNVRYSQNGPIPTAMEYLISAGNDELATELVSGVAEGLWTSGQIPLLLSWLDRLPIETVRIRPYLCVYYAWALAISGRLDEARARLQDARQAEVGPAAASTMHYQNPHYAGATTVDPGDLADLQGMIAFVQSALAFDVPERIRLAQEALALLSERKQTWRGVACLSLGLAYKSTGDVRSAKQLLSEAARISRMAENMYAEVFAMCNLGQVEITQGQLHAAYQSFNAALQVMPQTDDSRHAYLHWAHVGIGKVLYEWSELDEAIRHLELAYAARDQIGDAGNLALCYTTLTHAHAARGNLDRAYELAREAHVTVEDWHGTLLMPYLAAHLARLELRYGDAAAAQGWATQQPDLAGPLSDTDEVAALTLARVLIAQDAADQAGELLRHVIQEAESAERGGRLIEGLVLLAIAEQQRHAEQAVATLDRALSLAAPQGYIRTLLDEGTALSKLLLAWRATQTSERSQTVTAYANRLVTMLSATSASVDQFVA